MSSPLASNRGRLRLVAVGVLVAVTLAAALAIGAVRYGQQQDGTVAHAKSLRADMYALSLLEWRARAEGGVSDEVAALMRDRRADFVAQLRDLDDNDHEDISVHSVEQAARDYLEAYDKLVALLMAGDLEAAEVVDERQVDPAFEELEEAATAAENLAQASADTAAAVEVAAVGTLVPVCALGVLLLVRRESRRETELMLAQAQQASARRFESIIRGASDLVVVTDAAGGVTYASPAAAHVLGVPANELLGSPLIERVDNADRVALREGVHAISMTAGSQATLEFRVWHADGSWRVLESRVHNAIDDPAVEGLVWHVRDVTERRALEQQLTHQAFHDVLTGIPNRALLVDRTKQALARAIRQKTLVAAVVIDVDDFKDVNDSLGHAVGDEVLVAIAKRLQSAVRGGETVARLGGDEFVLLLEGLPDGELSLEMTRRALRLVAEPITAAGRELRLTASAGIALSRARDTPYRADDLIADADVAMYTAKKLGKNTCVLFEESMREEVKQRLDLTVDIRSAVDNGQIRVVYQPMVHLATGTIDGFEALARWYHPTRGLIPPATFIPLAEESGAIYDIGRHILCTACTDAGTWTANTAETGRLNVNVNLSPCQLADNRIVEHVRDALAEGGLPPHRLVLEITESAVVQNLATAQHRLRELRALGVRIAMDDFGTGYSSLAYLRHLPIDILKIDKSFIDDRLGKGPELLAGVVGLGATLGMLTVAEGIARAEQLNRARTAGCDYGQGYYFARPMDTAAVATYLSRQSSNRTTLAV